MSPLIFCPRRLWAAVVAVAAAAAAAAAGLSSLDDGRTRVGIC